MTECKTVQQQQQQQQQHKKTGEIKWQKRREEKTCQMMIFRQENYDFRISTKQSFQNDLLLAFLKMFVDWNNETKDMPENVGNSRQSQYLQKNVLIFG